MCTGVPDLLGERLSARPKCQQVHSMNLKVECLESYQEIYSGDVTGVA